MSDPVAVNSSHIYSYVKSVSLVRVTLILADYLNNY